jgi:hypothetical protein|tara:strand:+ start:42 stop:239 length:198 start_codon:yes stop_codon:yes gene_type:complete
MNKTYEIIKEEMQAVELTLGSYNRIYDYAVAEGFYELATHVIEAESAANKLYHHLYSQLVEMLVV